MLKKKKKKERHPCFSARTTTSENRRRTTLISTKTDPYFVGSELPRVDDEFFCDELSLPF
jgi:hypothetical protein